MMKPKRPRAPTSPLELANRKTDEEFIADYLQPGSVDIQLFKRRFLEFSIGRLLSIEEIFGRIRGTQNARMVDCWRANTLHLVAGSRPDEKPWTTAWAHPRTGAEYTIGLVRTENISDSDITACFRLIEQTSRTDYENSTFKWQPGKKLKEMRSPGLRYILVKEKDTMAIRGFTSLMPTYEEGEPVIYCYEIHLQPELQGTGLGSLLMGFHSTVAANLPPITKVMLTCFLSNQRGLDFYSKLGFENDEISPVPRKLRYGKIFTPDYVILSKTIRSILDSEHLNSLHPAALNTGRG